MGFWTAIFGDGRAANGKTPEELDAELRALQARRAQARPELFDTPEYNQAFEAHLELQAEQDRDIDQQIEEAFDEGLEEGAENVTGVLKKPFEVAGAGIGAILRAVPWWVWLGVAVYVFLSLGGLAWLRKRFA